jgi:hypothetical protein
MANENSDKNKTQAPPAAPTAPTPAATPVPGDIDITAIAEAAAKVRAAEVADANRLRAEAVKAAADGTAEFKVAPGLSVTCLRGHVDENQPIFAADFADKEKGLADLVSRGAIVKA